MGVRGELFSARVQSKNDRRTYFFNVKENRSHDVFVTVVESKKQADGEVFDRHQVVVFEEDLRLFRKGIDTVLEYLESRDGASTGSRRRDGNRGRDADRRGSDGVPRKKTKLKRRPPQVSEGGPADGAPLGGDVDRNDAAPGDEPPHREE